MTSRAQHFREAERALAAAGEAYMDSNDVRAQHELAVAQVHATLATVEAIVLDEDDRTVDLSAPVR